MNKYFRLADTLREMDKISKNADNIWLIEEQQTTIPLVPLDWIHELIDIVEEGCHEQVTMH